MDDGLRGTVVLVDRKMVRQIVPASASVGDGSTALQTENLSCIGAVALTLPMAVDAALAGRLRRISAFHRCDASAAPAYILALAALPVVALVRAGRHNWLPLILTTAAVGILTGCFIIVEIAKRAAAPRQYPVARGRNIVIRSADPAAAADWVARNPCRMSLRPVVARVADCLRLWR